MLDRLIRTHNDWSLFVTRVVLGGVMLPHGLQKTLGWFGGYGFSATVGHLGVPKPLAVLVILGESLGALALVLGLVGRFAAFGVVAIMAGAIAMVHAPNGLFMNWSGKQPGEGFEYHLLAIGMALAVMIRGSGAASVDLALQKGRRRD